MNKLLSKKATKPLIWYGFYFENNYEYVNYEYVAENSFVIEYL